MENIEKYTKHYAEAMLPSLPRKKKLHKFTSLADKKARK